MRTLLLLMCYSVRWAYTYYTALPNCGPPSPPVNGYIVPYTSTLEGVEVTFACQNTCQTHDGLQSPVKAVHLAVCNSHGNWEPNPADFCSSTRMWSLHVSHTLYVAGIYLQCRNNCWIN